MLLKMLQLDYMRQLLIVLTLLGYKVNNNKHVVNSMNIHPTCTIVRWKV